MMRMAIPVRLVVSMICVLAAPMAYACSSRGSEEERIASAERILHDSDFIADIEILDRSTEAPNLQRCEAMLGIIKSSCAKDEHSDVCSKLIGNLAVDCMEDGAARFKVVKVWKGAIDGTQQATFWTEVPCGWVYEPALGDIDTICGSIDPDGTLHISPCQDDGGVLKQYQAEWDSVHAAVNTAPENIDTLRALAEFSSRWDDLKAAFIAYAKMCQLTKTDATGCVGVAQTLIAEGNFSTAKPYLHLALQRDPENVEAKDLLRQATDQTKK